MPQVLTVSLYLNKIIILMENNTAHRKCFVLFFIKTTLKWSVKLNGLGQSASMDLYASTSPKDQYDAVSFSKFTTLFLFYTNSSSMTPLTLM